MTKWTLPEGRKPLTDADMADLTRRLSDIDELYQAAKRDAEEAEAYAAELEKERDAFKANADFMYAERMDAQERAEAAEAKLTKAVKALDEVDFKYDMQNKGSLYSDSWGGWESAFEEAAIAVRTTLAELKGEKDE